MKTMRDKIPINSNSDLESGRIKRRTSMRKMVKKMISMKKKQNIKLTKSNMLMKMDLFMKL